MKLYCIYTEDVNREAIVALCNEHLPGYTLIPALGYWQGKAEQSLVIEHVGEDAGRKMVELAIAIKQLNRQDSVLLTSHNLDLHLFV